MAILRKKGKSSHNTKTSYDATRKIATRLLDALREIPGDSRGRLEWIIRLVDSDPGEILKEPDKLSTIIHGLIAVLRFAPVDDFPWRSKKPNIKIVLTIWDRMLRATVKRERLVVAGCRTHLVYSEVPQRFVQMQQYDYCWEDSAALALAKLLTEHGHLLRQCPAPRLRTEGECENLFLARRPNNFYCSSQCQSRASTAMNRLPSRKKKLLRAKILLSQHAPVDDIRKRVGLSRKSVLELIPEA